MKDDRSQLIAVSELEIGMYVHLDLGWTEHPFSLNSFKIRSRSQIEQILSLGLEKIRYSPDQSDAPTAAESSVCQAEPTTPQSANKKQRRRDILERQRANLEICERRFNQVSNDYKTLLKNANADPQAAREEAETVVLGMVDEITSVQEAAIRLLSEKASGDLSLHPINVTIISLLLGQACGLEHAALLHLGLGALLHDIGKLKLPERLRWSEDTLTLTERPLFRHHVSHSIDLGKAMALPTAVLEIIGQHHEHQDGSGYPLGLAAGQLSIGGKILAIVNRYDNLCSPGHPARAMTPHDALAIMFAKNRPQFDNAIMTQFIRMMGVYPPGSVVRLSDDRYALVTTVNPLRPLKPQVILYDPQIPREDALIVDLERQAELGIQRCLSPLQLPRRVFEYLSPCKRICYYFERAREPGGHGDPS